MTDFHDVRFPLHLAFGARGGPVRSVDILELANGAEVRNARGRHSRRQYNAVAGLKSRIQAIELLIFLNHEMDLYMDFVFATHWIMKPSLSWELAMASVQSSL